MTGTLEADRTEEGKAEWRPQSVGGSEGGKAGLARMGAEGETGRGEVHQGGGKLLCLGDSAMQGFGSSA